MPVTKLTEKDVLDLVRKEMERKLQTFCDKNTEQEEVDEDDEDYDEEPEEEEEPGGRKENTKEKSDVLDADLLTKGIRIVHKDSKLEYPIVKIEDDKSQFHLRNAEGFPFVISREELEAEYALD